MTTTQERARPLVPTAATALNALFWPGVLLVLIGAVLLITGFVSAGSGAEKALAIAGGWESFWKFVGMAIPLFACAGLISGLGKRSPVPEISSQ